MLSLIRLDDRLIHGQVMAVWARQLSINHILVIDDDTAGDSFARELMQLAMPKHIRLTISTLADAPAALSALRDDATRALILLKSVAAATALHTLTPLPHLNVGNLGMRDGRRLIWRTVALSSAELMALHQLESAGVDVFLQMIPSDDRQRLPAE
jgi:mannose PTS system EIIAB component